MVEVDNDEGRSRSNAITTLRHELLLLLLRKIEGSKGQRWMSFSGTGTSWD
jgi:hypothetical protein